MPPDKKPKKAPNTGGGGNKAYEQIIFLLLGLFLLAAILTGFTAYFESFGLGTPHAFWARIADYFLKNIWPTWKFVAGMVSILALVGIIYNSWKLRAINLEEQKIYNPLSGTTTGDENIVTEVRNEKWEKVLKYLNSNNISDWRLAIIEADVMLEEMLRSKGFPGDSVGDMLKSADKSEFLSLDDAWEAHKVRNAIAHSGGDFQLTEREAKRVIALFEKVFKEFQVI